MNKGTQALVGLIVLIVVVIGGYAIFHKSSKTTSYNAPAANTKSSTGQAAAVNNAILTTKISSSVGSYLADPNGNTLYTYGADSSGTSNCTGSCLSTWPAYKDTGATTGLPTNVSTIKRSDNSETQYTYKGKPLYTFSSDSKGQVSGDGVNNFSVAKP
jgi:predicted lipoprotein with Yx(FWY)xxD motif